MPTTPTGTPVFLADGHASFEEPVFEPIKFGSGHDRMRRVRSVPDRVVPVRWYLEPEHVPLVRAWYEDELEAGTLEFTANIRNLGAGMETVNARWISIEWEMLHLGRAIVSGNLLVRDAPAGGPASIGWGPEDTGPFLHANEGTRETYDSPGFETIYAGVVDYVAQTVSWNPVWTPLYEGIGGFPPTVTPLSGGRVQVTYYREETGGASPFYTAGTITLTATIDGSLSDAIEVTVNAEFYAAMAWGPVP